MLCGRLTRDELIDLMHAARAALSGHDGLPTDPAWRAMFAQVAAEFRGGCAMSDDKQEPSKPSRLYLIKKEIARLAQVGELDHELERKDVAKRLEVSLSLLDRRVEAARPARDENGVPSPAGPGALAEKSRPPPVTGRPKPPSCRAVFRPWHEAHIGAQLERSQNSFRPPLCGVAWSTTVAGAPQATQCGSAFRKAARAFPHASL